MHGHALMRGRARTRGPRQATTACDPEPRPTDPTLQHPNCVFQILRRHFARYTPEVVAEVCGCSAGGVRAGGGAALRQLRAASAPRAICYALGWTQHTTGVQMIRAAGILQLLLGNIGRPGGGIMAMRGHSTIQGSTDVATLYDMPPRLPAAALRRRAPRAARHLRRGRGPGHRRLVQLPQLHREPAQGLVRRRGDAGERLRLRLAAPPRRRLLAAAVLQSHGQGRGEGLFPLRAEPRRRRAQRAAPPRRAPQSRLAGGAWTGSRSRAPSSGATIRRDRRRRRSRPRCSCSRPRARPRRKGASPTPSGCCSGTTRRSTPWATAAPTPGTSITSASGSSSSTPGPPIRATSRCSTSPGTTSASIPSSSPTGRRAGSPTSRTSRRS